MKAIAATLGLAAVLAACSGAPGMTPSPTQMVVATYLTAEITGILADEAGCLRITTVDRGSYLLVWPPDNAVMREGDTVRVMTGVVTGQPAEVVFRLGDTLHLGGGGGDTPDIVAGAFATLVPPECDGPYWVVGQLGEVVATAVP